MLRKCKRFARKRALGWRTDVLFFAQMEGHWLYWLLFPLRWLWFTRLLKAETGPGLGIKITSGDPAVLAYWRLRPPVA